MFIAHMTGWGYKELMEMKAQTLRLWYLEAEQLYKALNA